MCVVRFRRFDKREQDRSRVGAFDRITEQPVAPGCRKGFDRPFTELCEYSYKLVSNQSDRLTIGRKSWVLINSIKGAQASAVASSIVETAKLNDLNPYFYLEHLLTELPKLADEKGNIDTAALDALLPWAEELPKECHKLRR